MYSGWERTHGRLTREPDKKVTSGADSRPDRGAHRQILSDIPERSGHGDQTPPRTPNVTFSGLL
jgi:hypothetical protein